jgi:hypothetical protein
VKRLLIGAVSVLSLAAFSLQSSTAVAATPSSEYGSYQPFCSLQVFNCTELNDFISGYTGHDEPSLLFYSNTPGAGNNATYNLTLPNDPPKLPRQDGSGGTFNFQLHPAFWFGMAICDDQSAPNPGGSALGANVACTPDSDANIYNNSDATSSHYIGLHPGTAFMEMQFYPPGWVQKPFGDSCAPTRWCAALTIDSLSQNLNTGQALNPTCTAITGQEYVNFAFITKNGISQAPANPVDSTLATITPNKKLDLFMHSGDRVSVSMRDTRDGFQVRLTDRTSGQTGSMTAGAANGFGEVQWAPTGTSCVNIPTNFHPMYSTSSENTRVPWAAHSYNIAFSDEVGHFEYCGNVDTSNATCAGSSASDPAGPDSDEFPCQSAAASQRIRIGGCLGTDVDFDGPEYQNTWPGTFSDPKLDGKFHSTPIMFTSPVFNRGFNYDRVGFETNLPRVEGATNPPCQRFISNPASPNPGAGCVNPPVGASFYPFYTTTSVGGQCVWQLGGADIPGTTNEFGGSSTAEYGPLLALAYPGASSQPSFRFNNFRNILPDNPCPA